MPLKVVDSHTEGEPTRVVIEGGPDLGHGSLARRAARFAADHDRFRSAVILEPRGSDAVVGALLCPPSDPSCAAGVIFFNNIGLLGMCGHGIIGTAVVLAHLGRIGPGGQRFETPVGVVTASLDSANRVSVENVESYRHLKAVTLEADGLGPVTGDVAWGGNWFFLSGTPPFPLRYENRGKLTAAAEAVRQAIVRQGVTGAEAGEIDHIEFFGPAEAAAADSRNFVLCPGGAYDRSPCGTGTSAKLACLAADGLLQPGQLWTQESIIGSRYEAHYRAGTQGGVIPTVTGRAYVCAESTLLRHPDDPFADGIRPDG
ncbi:MAG: proline racemase family protein [Rhodospirillales bacterium]|nr:proline racemase family protein [Rhodospirillales bacterium]